MRSLGARRNSLLACVIALLMTWGGSAPASAAVATLSGSSSGTIWQVLRTGNNSAQAYGVNASQKHVISKWTRAGGWVQQVRPNAFQNQKLAPSGRWAAHSVDQNHTSPFEISRWSGSSWSPVAVPQPSDAYNGYGYFRSITDSWAFGTYTTGNGDGLAHILRFDGNAWQATDTSAVGDFNVQGGDGRWSWGRYDNGGFYFAPKILRWDGSEWSPTRLPPLPEGAEISAVRGRVAIGSITKYTSDRYPTTTSPLLLAWNGTAWERRTIAYAQPSNSRVEMWGIDGNLAIGSLWTGKNYSNSQALVLGFNGKSWSRVAAPTTAANLTTISSNLVGGRDARGFLLWSWNGRSFARV